MKLSALIVIVWLAATAFSQSGTPPQPTATPAASPPSEGYSESSPTRRSPSAKAADDPPRQSTERSAAASDDGAISIKTDFVTIPVTVLDRGGNYIDNLTESDFKIFEDGVEQQITYFGKDDKPITVVLLLDTSISASFRIGEIQQAASAFVAMLKPQDSVMVIEFDANVNVLTEPTLDRKRIRRAIEKADFGGGTSLFDAVMTAFSRKAATNGGRRAVVLFTDGVDTTSRKASFSSTLLAAEEADAIVMPIYYDTFENVNAGLSEAERAYPPIGTTPNEYARGRTFLSTIAQSTGGRVYVPPSTPEGLNATFRAVADELRRQYVLAYIPQKDHTPGERRSIRVRVNRPNLVVRSRDGYVVGANRSGKR